MKSTGCAGENSGLISAERFPQHKSTGSRGVPVEKGCGKRPGEDFSRFGRTNRADCPQRTPVLLTDAGHPRASPGEPARGSRRSAILRLCVRASGMRLTAWRRPSTSWPMRPGQARAIRRWRRAWPGCGRWSAISTPSWPGAGVAIPPQPTARPANEGVPSPVDTALILWKMSFPGQRCGKDGSGLWITPRKPRRSPRR